MAAARRFAYRPAETMRQFIHSGDLGDVIYSLPAVKALGGGSLRLSDVPGIQTIHGMTRQRFEAIRPLIAAQQYIRGTYGPGDVVPPSEDDQVIDLNDFRRKYRDLANEWLPNHYLDLMGLPRDAAHEPWLSVQPADDIHPVLVSRSARYHNPHFPWRRVIERYHHDLCFVGTPSEHAAFNDEFGNAPESGRPQIPHVPTETFLDAARLIARAQLFIGNQSCLLAIAEGLKMPIVCEVCPSCPNCNSPRSNFWAGRDGNAHLPDLADLEVSGPVQK